MFFFFFFKQKTAYEMRISDWSSDVCSSDLRKSVSTPTVITAPRAGITNVRRHPPPARDPAQHGQRDPPVRQHRRAPAPGAAAGLRHGRPPAAPRRPTLDRPALLRGLGATVLLLALYATDLPRWQTTLLVAGLLLVSRRLSTREMLASVDWHLLVLFGGLFVVTGAIDRKSVV